MADGAPAPRERPSAPSPRRQLLAKAVTAVVSTFVALALVEGLLRLAGYHPLHFVPNVDTRPIFNEPDPVLGWRSKPGTYAIPRADLPSAPRRLTILPDGSRATGSAGPAAAAGLLLGCSFTFGESVSDEDTFAWKLGEQLPGQAVRNFGVIGYGTYQSLLMLERLLARGERPAWVLYGYVDTHEIRNVGHPLWTYWLLNLSASGLVAVPYCRLDEHGELRRYPPRTHPFWPLQDHLASVNLLARWYLQREAHELIEEGFVVTERLVNQMAVLCREHGVRFGVVLLIARDEIKTRYTRAFASTGVRVIDCTAALTPERRIPKDGHPNEEAHADYARCIAEALTDEAR